MNFTLLHFRFTLKNKDNIEVNILNYGGVIKNIYMPDKDGKVVDIALGYDSLEGKHYIQLNGPAHEIAP